LTFRNQGSQRTPPIARGERQIMAALLAKLEARDLVA
jgi:hypothetical protein